MARAAKRRSIALSSGVREFMRCHAMCFVAALASTRAPSASAQPVSVEAYEVYVARVYSTVTVSVSVPAPPSTESVERSAYVSVSTGMEMVCAPLPSSPLRVVTVRRAAVT